MLLRNTVKKKFASRIIFCPPYKYQMATPLKQQETGVTVPILFDFNDKASSWLGGHFTYAVELRFKIKFCGNLLFAFWRKEYRSSLSPNKAYAVYTYLHSMLICSDYPLFSLAFHSPLTASSHYFSST